MSSKANGRPAEPAGHGKTEIDVIVAGIVRDAEGEGEGLCGGDEGRLRSQ